MQAYGERFAKVYNLRWTGFAQTVASHILKFYENTPAGQKNKAVLDLCCGTGQLALQFLKRGYKVVGIDLSLPMLQYARENAKPFIEKGQAEFFQGDASDFALDEQFGLVVSTYDSLNHLEDERALQNCFRCVFDALEAGGHFIFDLNTRLGLMRWNNITVNAGDEEAIIITRGMYDGEGDKAWMKISGFIRVGNGLYERFEETVFNTVFDMERVRQALEDTGWREIHFARVQELGNPLEKPESESRVFIVARK